jgi:hypothetical protein
MNNDFSKLKNYVSEKNNPTSLIENTFLNAKATVSNFFNQNSNGNSLNLTDPSRNGDDQSESWFKDADSDPYCPKLVWFYIIYC